MLGYSELKVALDKLRDHRMWNLFEDKTNAAIVISSQLLRCPLHKDEDLMANQYYYNSLGIGQKEILSIEASREEKFVAEFNRHAVEYGCRQVDTTVPSIECCKDIIEQIASQGIFESIQRMAGEQSSRAIEIANELKENGYYLMKGVISDIECEEILRDIERIARQEREGGYAYLYGNKQLSQRIYHLVMKSECANRLLKMDIVKAVADSYFTRQTNHDLYYLTSWHANILNSGAAAQKVHIDENVPEPIPEWPIRLNVNFILQDYTEQNGATHIYPGTNKLLMQPKHLADYKAIVLAASRGSIAFWTGKVWHNSGENRTSSPRFALLAGYCNSIMRELVAEEDNIKYAFKSNSIEKVDRELMPLLAAQHGLKDYRYD